MGSELRRRGIPVHEKGAALGVAELDITGKVPLSQIPPSVIDAMDYLGPWDASGGTMPVGPANGDTYRISVQGTLPVVGFAEVGDLLVYDLSTTSWSLFQTNMTVGDLIGNIQANGANLGASQIVETDGAKKIITAAKNDAYNKAYGSGAGTTCQGNDARLSDISCSAYDGSGVSIPLSAWTKVTLDSEEYDTDNIQSGGTITILAGKAGKYLIIACVSFPGDTNGIRGLRLKHNAAYVRTKVSNPVGTSKTDLSFAKLLDLAETDTVEMEGYQSALVPLTTEIGADRTFLQAVRQRG